MRETSSDKNFPQFDILNASKVERERTNDLMGERQRR